MTDVSHLDPYTHFIANINRSADYFQVANNYLKKKKKRLRIIVINKRAGDAGD